MQKCLFSFLYLKSVLLPAESNCNFSCPYCRLFNCGRGIAEAVRYCEHTCMFSERLTIVIVKPRFRMQDVRFPLPLVCKIYDGLCEETIVSLLN